MSDKNGYTIGIDLGTTNSCFAISKPTGIEILTNIEGTRTTPSVVAFSEGNILVGSPAVRQGETNPYNTIYSAKRIIGQNYSEISGDLAKYPVSYKISSGDKGQAVIVTSEGKQYNPVEISAYILRKIKEDAEKILGGKVTNAVITVPAYFNDSQRQATKQAGEIAGLVVDRIINEPTAAAMAYGLDKNSTVSKKVVIFDLGGGTFDVTIMNIHDGVFEVLSTSGDTHLGGEDFDNKIVAHVISEFEKTNNIKLSSLPESERASILYRIKRAAEDAKKELSSTLETNIKLPYLCIVGGTPKHLDVKLNRATLESLTKDLIKRTITPCEEAIKQAGLAKHDISEVVLVGGMTRMPAVIDIVKNFFGKEPCKGVNPDEVVAYGAAVQAGVLRGHVSDIILVDVTPLDLGIETMGNVMTVMIPRNASIPAKKIEVFSTAADNQTSVDIRVCQGNRPLANDNKLLGSFVLTGIPPAPRGVPQIEVTFEIDQNGIMNISAIDKATSKRQNVTISNSGLTKEDIEEMKQKAEEHADEDRIKLELINTRNSAQSIIFSTEELLKKNESLNSEIKTEVQAKLDALKAVVETDAVEDIKSKQTELTDALTKLYGELSKAAGAAEAHADDANSEQPTTDNPSESDTN